MDRARKWLPPMSALNSFDAAATHGSFSRAGVEVGLTQSAVSRQIALLEDWLQTPLFDRVGRRVQLNEAGQAYAEEIRPALDRIRRATRRVAARLQPAHAAARWPAALLRAVQHRRRAGPALARQLIGALAV